MIRIAFALLALGCVEPTAATPTLGSTPAVKSQDNGVSTFSIDPSRHTIYVRFAGLQDDGREPIHVLIRRMFESADAVSAEKLIVDLRGISGGDAKVLVPLIRGIMARDRFLRSGALYVVLGPDSYSPVQSAATLLSQYAKPIMVQRLQWSF
ncbi:MAG TPA: hypothetical protein VJ840_08160 [Gemmatimonadaceae bacterium]|nr:hypothetical protein [Gemmatimonadaceae bacterium]